MQSSCTGWHIALSLLLVAGCSGSHTRDDCPDVVGTCMDECCTASVEPTFDAACNATCPSGTRLVDRCAPLSSCRMDGGTTSCGDADGGPLPPCWGGPCCDEMASPDYCDTDGPDRCPEGFSWSCEPDPRAFCEPPWLACDEPTDCNIVPADCCLPCDALALDDVTAVNERGAGAYHDSVCPDDFGCPPCAPTENAALIATCNAADQCEAVDVRQHPVSACTADSDCRLRAPECCECGAPISETHVIAVRADAGGAYEALVCPTGFGCPECAPDYPTTVEAYCADDGHCAVRPIP